MSGALPLGNWWNSGTQQAAPIGAGAVGSPLLDYAARLRAAGAAAPQGAMGGATSPLAAAYTPPVYQTTPPHVDIQAIIAAMNAAKPPPPPGPVTAATPMVTGTVGPGGSEMGAESGAQAKDAVDRGDFADTMNQAGIEMGSYKAGGYTGNAPVTQPVGVVHGQEEVISAPATKAVGKATLMKINEADPKAIALAKKVADGVGRRNDRGRRGEKWEKDDAE